MTIGPLLIRQFHLILRFYEGEKEPSLREPGHGFFLIWSLCGKVFNWPGFFCMWIDWGPFEYSSCFLFTQLVVCEKNKNGLLNYLRFFTSKRWLGKRPCIFTRLQSIGYEDPTMHVQLHVSNQFLFFFQSFGMGIHVMFFIFPMERTASVSWVHLYIWKVLVWLGQLFAIEAK